MKIKKLLFFLLLFLASYAYGKEDDDSSETDPPKTGNFILSTSQQPGPFVSFGQNIIDKNQWQYFLEANEFKGDNTHMDNVVPSILYGISDKFSVFFNMPIAASFRDKQGHSSGLEDFFLQFEYAFYSHNTHDFTDQATFVTNMTFPTGSSTKEPATGFGSPSFFEGFTFNRTYIKWFYFTSYGAILPTEKDNTRFGNQYLYQGGLGRNLFDIGTKWIFASMVEADGTYSEKNNIDGTIDPNSGGNVVYITPSLWISSKNLIFQFGVGFPAIQDLNGDQEKNDYLLQFNLGWTF